MKIIKYIVIFYLVYKLNCITFIKSPKIINNINNKKFIKIELLKSSKKFKQKYIILTPYLINKNIIELFINCIDIINNIKDNIN